MPPVLKDNAGLTQLKLNGCTKLQSLPDLRQCPALETLHIDGTGVTSPPDLRSCKGLKVLSMCDCPGIKSPPDLSACVSTLRTLDLSGTELTSLPKGIFELPSDAKVSTIDVSHLTKPERSRLEAIIDSSSYAGPRMKFVMEMKTPRRRGPGKGSTLPATPAKKAIDDLVAGGGDEAGRGLDEAERGARKNRKRSIEGLAGEEH